MIRLNANESPFDLPQGIKEEIFRAARDLPFNRYDAGLAAGLREQLAAYADPGGRGLIKADNIVLGNGSDELILIANQVFSGPGGRTVIVAPSFEMYTTTTRIVGAELGRYETDEDFRVDPDALIEACRDASLVFLCRPNNPTGTVAPIEVVKRLIAETRAVVVIDEAYHEFSGLTLVELVSQYERVVVFRTMSKFFSFAGLRLGYAIAPVPLAERMAAAKQPFNVSSLTQLAAGIVLRRRAELEPNRRLILAETARLEGELRRRPGVTVYPSGANFMLVRIPVDAEAFWTEMQRNGVLVRRYPTEPRLKYFIRVNGGRREESDAFLKAFDATLAVLHPPTQGTIGSLLRD